MKLKILLCFLLSVFVLTSVVGCVEGDVSQNEISSETVSGDSSSETLSDPEPSEEASSEVSSENESSEVNPEDDSGENLWDNPKYALDGADILFKMNYGIERGDIKIGVGYSQDAPLNKFVAQCAEHFIVKKNKNVAVLDSENFAIIEYKHRSVTLSDGTVRDYIDNQSAFSGQTYLYFGSLNNSCDRPIMFCEADGGYVVAVKDYYYEYYYTERTENLPEFYFVYVRSGEVPKFFIVPDDSELNGCKLAEMYFDNGKLFVSTQNSLYFEIDMTKEAGTADITGDISHLTQSTREYSIFESRDGNSITVTVGKDADFVTCRNIGYDAEGNLYIFNRWRDTVKDVYNIRISKYNRDGDEVGYWFLEDCYLDTVSGEPYRSAFVTPEGEVYFIRFYEDAACVYKVNLQTH